MQKPSVSVAPLDRAAPGPGARGGISAASSPDELDETRIRYLGRKSELKQALRAVRDRESGMTLNALRERLEAAFDTREAELERDRLVSLDQALDVTLPGAQLRRGHLHPFTQIRR